ncbi:DEAD/DEAH box helicase [Lentilactobacillus sp. SPB1-3]|uniref:DEAD/DEAH box helicase n=1 Tax=Lentilactobacillus terminaliae TaxID=3003483 RepID=A0ACD5DH42_9LACO|nr:helicase-related protein [Lentilactobacillus sp. SPB1-3]MCZ0976936.1 helicase-related protein [Lentilactobacillus sp. SPB1-3]
MDTLSKLATVREPNQFEKIDCPLQWDGQLTNDQQRCSNKIKQVIQTNGYHLLWAVTGAGKTEMLFAGIAQALAEGKRVALASPRIDVINELLPRFKAAFPRTDICLLHGQVETGYRYCQLTICTTHQLMKFYRAFDVLVIDEVDVFPYAGNKMLHYAADKAIKTNACQLYLTATPDDILMKQIKNKQIGVSYLPRRYHGFPLPEITTVKIKKMRTLIEKRKLPKTIIEKIAQIIDTQALLIFVPKIADLASVAETLKRANPNWRSTTVYSADPERIEKVQMMRDGKLDFLITTTILERGVTFKNLSVIVISADNDIFSASSLVQIAGRVGRNAAFPTGKVIFYIEQINSSIKSAQAQIKKMNGMANVD